MMYFGLKVMISPWQCERLEIHGSAFEFFAFAMRTLCFESVGEDVAGLAIEGFADGLQRGEADGFGFSPVLRMDRFARVMSTFSESSVSDMRRCSSTSSGLMVMGMAKPFLPGSSRMAAPAAKMRLRTKTIRTEIHPPKENGKSEEPEPRTGKKRPRSMAGMPRS